MDIVHYLQVNSTIESVFQVISTSAGLSKWWTLDTRGHSELGAILELDFGPDYQWQAQVTNMVAPHEFEIALIKADPDWLDSTIRFELASSDDQAVQLKFHHQGWNQANDHFYISCYCWAMYLRLMKRYVEFDEFVPYPDRLNV